MIFHSIISYQLKQKYPDFTIYKERAEKLNRPAFSIFLVNQEQRKGIGNVYRRKTSYMICCFLVTDDDTDYVRLQAIAEDLYSYFEEFSFKGESLRGYDMNHRIQDNVLQFFVSFSSVHHKDIKKTKMKDLEVNTEYKK